MTVYYIPKRLWQRSSRVSVSKKIAIAKSKRTRVVTSQKAALPDLIKERKK